MLKALIFIQIPKPFFKFINYYYLFFLHCLHPMKTLDFFFLAKHRRDGSIRLKLLLRYSDWKCAPANDLAAKGICVSEGPTEWPLHKTPLDPHRRVNRRVELSARLHVLSCSCPFYPVCVCVLILDMAAGKESLWCVMEQLIISHSAPHTVERRRKEVEGENGERGLAVIF